MKTSCPSTLTKNRHLNKHTGMRVKCVYSNQNGRSAYDGILFDTILEFISAQYVINTSVINIILKHMSWNIFLWWWRKVSCDVSCDVNGIPYHRLWMMPTKKETFNNYTTSFMKCVLDAPNIGRIFFLKVTSINFHNIIIQ